jgi:hypothetical protein
VRDEGEIGGLDAVILGLVVLVLFPLVAADLWGLIEARLVATEASQAGVASLIGTTDTQNRLDRARSAVVAVLEAAAVPDNQATVALSGPAVRCAAERVQVTIRVHLIRVPLLFSSAPSESVTASTTGFMPAYGAYLPANNCHIPNQ